MSAYREKIAKTALHFKDAKSFYLHVEITGRASYGWIGPKFYQLYPGGSCIQWTATLKSEQPKGGK
jgi:hypothetical protein